MFPIIVNDGQTQLPKDDIYYIICKEGVYLKKRLGIMESIAPVKNISILKSIKTMAKMHIKKIPAIKAQKVINFFKAVYKEYHSEAIVLLFYNQKTNQHKIICPNQKVSGGIADYNKSIIINGWDMIGTIHSHAAMSAFHSGIDDKDEESFDGLHITFGNINDDDISVSASIVANGFRVIVDPRDYINKMELTVNIDKEEKVPYATTWRWNSKINKMVQIETVNKFYNRRTFDQRYRIKLSKNPNFDSKWMNLVKKKKLSVSYINQKNKWYDGWYGHNSGYGVSSHWNPLRKHQSIKTSVQSQAYAGVKTDDKKVDENPKIIQNLERLNENEQKTIIEWVLNRLDEDADGLIKESIGEDNDDLTYYHCINCQDKFTVDESTADACCYKCGIDDYLVEISATEMMDDSDIIDEENEADGLDMIECQSCHSSFTKDFLIDGDCPTCGTVLIAEEHPSNNQMFDADYEDDGFIQCPSCKKQFAKVLLHFNNCCKFCNYEFDQFTIENIRITTEEINEEIFKIDSGAYSDPNREAIENIMSLGEDAERIPIPDQRSIPINRQPRKPGNFAKLFNRRNIKL